MGFDADAFTKEARGHWDAVAPHYERMSAGLFAPITAAFAAFCAAAPGEKILDVACGPGTLSTPLATAAGAENVVGVDLAEAMLARARARVPRARFLAMNAEALELPDAAFDLVACQLGLMLFARPTAALGEMVRVARSGGRVACLVQGTREGMRFTSLLMTAIAKRAPQLKTPGAPVLFAYGPAGTLDAALAAAGLSNVRSRVLAGTLDFACEQAYWDEMQRSAGRTGAVLRSLDEPTRELIRTDVWRALDEHRAAGGRLAVPFEVVMARGIKP